MQKSKIATAFVQLRHSEARAETRENLRCGCGSLMARILKEGIELKCRRCKGITLIPLSEIAGGIQNICSETFRAG